MTFRYVLINYGINANIVNSQGRNVPFVLQFALATKCLYKCTNVVSTRLLNRMPPRNGEVIDYFQTPWLHSKGLDGSYELKGDKRTVKVFHPALHGDWCIDRIAMVEILFKSPRLSLS